LLSKIISTYKRQQRQKYESIDQTEIAKTKHRQYKNYTQEIKWETLLATNHLQCLAFDNASPLMAKIKEDIVAFCKDRKYKNGNGKNGQRHENDNASS
jgi:predicted histidine transporter YuiF (NhaC family)